MENEDYKLWINLQSDAKDSQECLQQGFSIKWVKVPHCVKCTDLPTSSVASPICQEGQYKVWKSLPDFGLFFPIFIFFLDFSWFSPSFFPIFGNFSAVRGGTLPPFGPPSGYATGTNISFSLFLRGSEVPHVALVSRDSAGMTLRVMDSLKSIWDLFGPLFSSFILVKGSLWTPNFFDLPLLQMYVGLTMLYLGPLLFHFWRVLGVSMGFFRPYKIFPRCHPRLWVVPPFEEAWPTILQLLPITDILHAVKVFEAVNFVKILTVYWRVKLMAVGPTWWSVHDFTPYVWSHVQQD